MFFVESNKPALHKNYQQQPHKYITCVLINKLKEEQPSFILLLVLKSDDCSSPVALWDSKATTGCTIHMCIFKCWKYNYQLTKYLGFTPRSRLCDTPVSLWIS